MLYMLELYYHFSELLTNHMPVNIVNMIALVGFDIMIVFFQIQMVYSVLQLWCWITIKLG